MSVGGRLLTDGTSFSFDLENEVLPGETLHHSRDFGGRDRVPSPGSTRKRLWWRNEPRKGTGQDEVGEGMTLDREL